MEGFMFDSQNRFAQYMPPLGTSEKSLETIQFGDIAKTQDLYVLAWSKAQQDYEIDRLFNASFHYEI